jgi:hypothetical protein
MAHHRQLEEALDGRRVYLLSTRVHPTLVEGLGAVCTGVVSIAFNTAVERLETVFDRGGEAMCSRWKVHEVASADENTKPASSTATHEVT